ncbi:alpha/beta-hydrolase [Rhodocollybia butyracea]|uniref:Alpha/beta-hydrolase n=1 Tax=Rhodocollybia butyracea TaxID=206335 RepID=A0A9P5PMM3_9AGAR|nr:alpha/beta-hydrolase [Rhodocollybia butyracea]
MPADSNEKPFKIAISDEQLSLLSKKLALHVLPDELEGAGKKYGASLTDVRRLVSRWQNSFDWRKEEARINEELPQFTRDIDVEGHGTLNIHYVHQKSEVDNAIPMLFVHGWPGSFIEVRKILPLLLNPGPDHPAFHVVALSLPGYGFSQGPKLQGFKSAQYAEVGNKLMLALGYEKYVTQGGDWGSIVTRQMANMYGNKHLMAWHTNFLLTTPPTPTSKPLPEELSDPRAARGQWYFTQGNGYFVLQSTQPQTIGYSLADSPVGLLTWIYEKLVNWTDNYPWDDDEVLTWISIYWFSRAGPAAASYMYYEIDQTGEITAPFNWTTEAPVKLGASSFPKEIFYAPPSWVKVYRGLVFQADHDRGGHFAAYEVPELLVQDLRMMFGKAGPAYGVVPNKSGYST